MASTACGGSEPGGAATSASTVDTVPATEVVETTDASTSTAHRSTTTTTTSTTAVSSTSVAITNPPSQPSAAAPEPAGPSVSFPPYTPLPGVTGLAPLTGLAVDDATAALPILAVKVDNHPAARGQWGLDGADVVFEENVEQLTRFVALFQSRQPAEVGPVRSARTGDIDVLAGMNRPVLAWSGGNKGVTRIVRAADAAGLLVDLSALRVNCYRRDGSRKSPHNLVLNTACARVNQDDAGPARPLWSFADPAAPVVGAPDGAFDVKMDGVAVRWQWDPAGRSYLRFQDGRQHVSAGGVPVAVTNVVVISAVHIPSPVDARTPEPQTVGTGRVAVHTGGVVRTGSWTRALATDPWTFTADDGTPILLAPGSTFVELARA